MNRDPNSTDARVTSEPDVLANAGLPLPTVTSPDEDRLLSTLKRAEITAAEIAEISRSAIVIKSRKVTMAIVSHPRTPRHISVPLLRLMFIFDLMRVSLIPVVAADIKRAAEDQVLLRTESLSVGEKISLAKRASGRTAAALLQQNDRRVIDPALDNAQLTEPLVVQALMEPSAPELLFRLTSAHRKWSQRREVQIALLRSQKTPLERAKELASNFPIEFVRDIVPDSRKPELIAES